MGGGHRRSRDLAAFSLGVPHFIGGLTGTDLLSGIQRCLGEDRAHINLVFDFGPHAASRERASGLCDFEGNSRTPAAPCLEAQSIQLGCSTAAREVVSRV